jgi:hypothetical protein
MNSTNISLSLSFCQAPSLWAAPPSLKTSNFEILSVCLVGKPTNPLNQPKGFNNKIAVVRQTLCRSLDSFGFQRIKSFQEESELCQSETLANHHHLYATKNLLKKKKKT